MGSSAHPGGFFGRWIYSVTGERCAASIKLGRRHGQLLRSDAPMTDRDLGVVDVVPVTKTSPAACPFHLPASGDRTTTKAGWSSGTGTPRRRGRFPRTIHPARGTVPAAHADVRAVARCCAVRQCQRTGLADLVRLRRGHDAASADLMQADEMLYLHREVWSRLQGPAIDVDADPLPDVVLEGGPTRRTMRRREARASTRRAGFRRFWVLVPWAVVSARSGADDPCTPR